MTDIRIRAGSDAGPDLTLGEAVEVLTDPPGGVVVVTVVDEDGDRVFGQYAETVVSTDLGTRKRTAVVRMPGVGAHDPDTGMIRATCYLTAITIAAAVNAVPPAGGQS